MPRLAPILSVLLAGCSFHRPAWDAVTAPAIGDAAAPPTSIEGARRGRQDTHLPTTAYRVTAQTGAKRRTWLLQLDLAVGDELARPASLEPLPPPDESTLLVVTQIVTPLGHPEPAQPRHHQFQWFPLLGSGAWEMAVELETLRDGVDSATATARLLAEERRPLSGLAAILNLGMALGTDREIEAALLETGRRPSWFDEVRAYLRQRTFDCSDAREFLTLQPLASEAVVVDEPHGPGIRQRMAVDVTVGSTHVVRIVVDTVPVTGPLDLSQGITRVVIQHPRDPKRFVLVERVDGAPIDG